MSADYQFIRRFQDHLEAQLLSAAPLQYVSIASMRKQVKVNPDKRVAPHIAGRSGKVGAGILINFPIADPTDTDIPGAQMECTIPIDILASDDLLALSNGAGVNAEEILIHVWQTLHQFMNQALGSGNIFVDGFDPIEDRKGAYGYRLPVRVRFGSDQPAKISTPVISFAGTLCTLTPVESGSAIYYTLDGSFPGAGNSAATLYAAPFNMTQGQTVLWAGYKANYLGSDVWSHTADFT